MSNFISKLAFYFVSYNFIIAVIFIWKIALQYAIEGVMLLIGNAVGEMDRSFELDLGVMLTLIASLASIIIGIMSFKRTRMQFEKIKRIQTINAIFVVLIMVLIAPPLSFITLFFLIFINA